ncbi:MAG: hypothetical protein HC841_02905 [Verrucomicrobiae bacterium]|nr:hypothetical protein [Verrucomicrobiae bacterium]
MKTIISSKGQIVLPAPLRERDRIATGQRFDIERLDAGQYLLKRRAGAGQRRPGGLAARLSREGLVPTHRFGIHRFIMKYLVDANVLSEPTKPAPDAAVLDWLRDHERELTVSPIILGELEYGILILPASRRRTRLEQWFAAGVQRMRVLDLMPPPLPSGRGCWHGSRRRATPCRLRTA